MTTELTSTKTRVRDPQMVRVLLYAYKVRGVETRLSDEGATGTLSMAYQDVDPDWFEWPVALHRDQWPDEEPDAGPEEPDTEEDPGDEDRGETEWDRCFDEMGQEGFLALLRRLAPYLETPLLIQATISTWDDRTAGSRAWLVHPGSREVVTLSTIL
jgi:hypothetical protein